MTKCALLVALLAVLGCRPAAAGEEDAVQRLEKRIGALEQENALLRTKVLWLELLQRREPRSSVTVVHEFPLGGGGRRADGKPGHLEGIRLADAPTKDAVRDYVARVVAAAGKHRQGSYSYDDPEIELLRKVGSANVDVLVELLVCFPHLDGDYYVIQALHGLVRAEHKALFLEALPVARQLVEVVALKGWNADAAPTLLRILSQRSRYVSTDWVEAAARVARPEHYEDLKFYVAHGFNPFHNWTAIRHLPGMEPLDGFVHDAWRTTRAEKGSWEWKGLAVVAAHYGHLDALEVLVQVLTELNAWWESFQQLTGFDEGGAGRPRLEEARAWFAANRQSLVFDREQRRYKPGK